MAASPEPNNRELYAVLNVAPDAADDEIKRAYRQLATTYHPDKANDPEIQEEATVMFKRVQEAYEILSDKDKRDIYDVYGIEGLTSGLELADPLKSRDELRKEWEKFREKQKQHNIDAQVNHRGVYVFRVDASALAAPYSPGLPRTPELSNVYMTTGIDVPIEASKDWGFLSSERDTVHLGGLVSVRKEVGGGSFLAGYKRSFADYSTLELHGAVGLKSMVSVQSSVQLSQYSSASLISTWQPRSGLGLQFVTSRQLSDTYSGEVSWVLGPQEAQGVSVGVNRRTEKTALAFRVDVGAATGLAVRIVRQLTEALTGRIGVKFGTTGIELDIGGSRKVSELSTAGLSVVVGLQGIMLRVRYNRAGHLFEFPVFLSPRFDPRVLVGAYLLPPLSVYVVMNGVVRPLQKLIEHKRAKNTRLLQATTIRKALSESAAAAKLMQGVAKRRVTRELSCQGLVVVLALYGEESAVKEESLTRLKAVATVPTTSTDGDKKTENNNNNKKTASKAEEKKGGIEHRLTDLDKDTTTTPSTSTSTTTTTDNTTTQTETNTDNTEQQTQDALILTSGDLDTLPPAIVDVTTAVQYMCEHSKIVLHKGYTKSGCMGFCDPSPGSYKILQVYYTYKGKPYVAMVGDTEGCVLPSRGTLIVDEEEKKLMEVAVKNVKSAIGR